MPWHWFGSWQVQQQPRQQAAVAGSSSSSWGNRCRQHLARRMTSKGRTSRRPALPSAVKQHTLQAAGPQAQAQPQQQLKQAQQGQVLLAGLLSQLLDLMAAEAGQPPGNLTAGSTSAQPAPGTPALVIDAFAAAHALLPAVGSLPIRTATVGGLQVSGLADRLAVLASKLLQMERRYPLAACLAPACKQLHAVLGTEAAAGEKARGCNCSAAPGSGGAVSACCIT